MDDASYEIFAHVIKTNNMYVIQANFISDPQKK